MLGIAGPVRAQTDAPCQPAVSLAGEPALVTQLARGLSARGIGSKAAPGCPVVQAQVARGPTRIAVSIMAIVDQRTDREFVSPELALDFIDSWTRRDISGPLLTAQLLPTTPSLPPLPEPAPRPKGPRVDVAARLDLAGSTDRALWVGAHARACGYLGPVCLGSLVRAETAVYPASQIQRVNAIALLSAELALRTRHVHVVPGLGLGVGFLRSTAPPGQMSMFGGTRVLDQGGMRAAAYLGLSFPLPRGFGIDVGADAEFLFLAQDSQPPPFASPPVAILGGAAGVRWSGP